MRSELSSRIFALKHNEMTSATVVGDVIRKIDIEVARFSKLLATLPSHLDRQGLSIGDGDMLVILLRSLPDDAKKYVLHHSTGDTYLVARTAALKFEQQQRLFLDLNFGNKKHVSQLFDLTVTDEDDEYEKAWYDEGWDVSVSAVQADRCMKCGRKHKTANCNTDMSTVKCFACQEYGHISGNCPKSRGSSHGESFQASGSAGKGKKGAKGKGKESGKSKGKDKGKTGKGKGKGQGKGKKGKMYELTEQTPEQPETTEGAGWDDAWWEGAWWGESWGEEDWTAQSAAPEGGNPATTPTPQLCALFIPSFLNARSSLGEQRSAESSFCDMSDFCSCDDKSDCFSCMSSVCSSNSCGDTSDFLSCGDMSDQVEVAPLLMGEVFENAHDEEWWLVDSGAGVTVLSEQNARFFGVTEESLTAAKIDQGFSAANGSPVRMLVEVQIEVEVLLEDHSGERSHRSAVMNVWVGETQHNILSTTMLCFRGWTFAQDRDGITLQAPGGAVAAEVTLYGNVPWLRLRPSKSSGVASSESLPLASVVVAPVTRSTEAELAQHRLQGHTPFHPGCRHCQVARSVHQHRKKSGGRIESEVIADFFYLTTTGEDLRSMNVDHLKVLVMVERMSNMIGAVVISSNVVQTRSAIVAWLKEFGLTSGACSVRLVTDAEGAVADLVGTASGAFTFQVKRAEPQNHEAADLRRRVFGMAAQGLPNLNITSFWYNCWGRVGLMANWENPVPFQTIQTNL